MTLLLYNRRHVSLLQSPIRHPWNGLNSELPDHVLGVQRQEGRTPRLIILTPQAMLIPRVNILNHPHSSTPPPLLISYAFPFLSPI